MKYNIPQYVFVFTKILSRSKPFKRPPAAQFSSSLGVSLSVYLSKDLVWLLVCKYQIQDFKIIFNASSNILSFSTPIAHSKSASKFQVLQSVLSPQLCTPALFLFRGPAVPAVPAGWVPDQHNWASQQLGEILGKGDGSFWESHGLKAALLRSRHRR